MLENQIRTVNTAFTVLKRVVRPCISRVGLSLTYDCNQKCKTCDVWQVNRRQPELRQKEMTLEEVQKFSEANSKPGLIWIALTGGEPFIKKDMKGIIEAINTIPTLRMISITTNGSLPDKIEEDLRHFLTHGNKMTTAAVQISFEGPEEDQTMITGIESSYKKAKESLRVITALSKESSRIRAQISYTLSKYSQGNLKALLSSLDGLCPPLDRIHVGIGWNADYYQFTDGRDVAPDTKVFLEEINWLKSKFSWKSWLDPISLVSTKTYLNKVSKNLGKGVTGIGCAAAQISCSIDPYWDVHPCTYLFRLNLGSLKNYGYNVQSLLDYTETIWRPKVMGCLKNGGCKNLCEAYPTVLFRPWKML